MGVTVHTMEVSSSLRHLRSVREFVVQHARQAHFPEDAIDECRLAVCEACTNVIEHAYQGQPGRLVKVSVAVGPDRLSVRITDNGKAFDRSTYFEPEIRRLARERRSGGLGVHIIRRLMDRVEYRSRDGKNEIRMVKYRP